MAWFSPNSPPRRSSSYSQSHSHRPSSPHRSTSNSKSYYATTSSSSRGHQRAAPRSGYINRLVRQIRHYLRRLYNYARNNPVKLLLLVLPLLTGGALAGVLAKFGVRLPRGLEGMLGGRRGGSGIGGMGGMGGMGGGGVEGLLKVAKMFV
ncbi:hypothetical protein MMC21_004657 [Puttea exsequens]|nr:hypothetical protein [Puttea exsequens]